MGAWELNKISSYTAGTITLKYPLMNTYTDSVASQAQVRVMKQYTDVTINSGQTYTSKAWTGDVGGILAFFAKGTVTITGSINAVGKGFRGGTSSDHGAGSGGYTHRGEGTLGGFAYSNVASGNAGGGTHKSSAYQASASGGGNGTVGGNGSGGDGSTGGAVAGNAELTSMVYGGGGGAGWGDGSGVSIGGAGGGLILIFSNELIITGSILAGGSNGGNATFGGAGGGAGGSVLLKGKNLTLGSNKITAPGGSGGPGQNGGTGGVGRIHIDYKTSYTGTTSPTIDARQDLTLNPISSGFLAFM